MTIYTDATLGYNLATTQEHHHHFDYELGALTQSWPLEGSLACSTQPNERT